MCLCIWCLSVCMYCHLLGWLCFSFLSSTRVKSKVTSYTSEVGKERTGLEIPAWGCGRASGCTWLFFVMVQFCGVWPVGCLGSGHERGYHPSVRMPKDREDWFLLCSMGWKEHGLERNYILFLINDIVWGYFLFINPLVFSKVFLNVLTLSQLYYGGKNGESKTPSMGEMI